MSIIMDPQTNAPVRTGPAEPETMTLQQLLQGLDHCRTHRSTRNDHRIWIERSMAALIYQWKQIQILAKALREAQTASAYPPDGTDSRLSANETAEEASPSDQKPDSAQADLAMVGPTP